MAEQTAETRPNILLILIDALQRDVTYHEGRYPFVHTPAVDRLRADGVTFANAFVQFTTCVPSRACLATGRYAHELGIYNHRCRIPDHVPTVADYLDGAGYETVAFGRTHDQHKGFRTRLPNRTGLEGFGTTLLGNDAPSDQIVGVYPGPTEQQHDMHAALQFADWLRARGDPGRAGAAAPAVDPGKRPFFAHVGFMAPHTPYWPPRAFAGVHDAASLTLPEIGEAERRSQNAMQRHVAEHRWLVHPPELRRRILARYFDLVGYVDACVGVVLDALQAAGLLEETLVVLTADHGEMLGEHEMIAKWFSLYDEALRVPLILRLPGGRHASLRLEHDTELVDLAPTLLEAAGVRPPPQPELEANGIPHEPLSGRSLLPLLADPRASHKEAVFSMTENGRMIRADGWKLVLYAERPCFNYPDTLFDGADQAGELYDLTEDPGEHRNRLTDHSCAAVKADLAVGLVQHFIRHHHWLGKHGPNRH